MNSGFISMPASDQNFHLYLASTSPRRQALLRQAGYAFEALTIAIDETPGKNEKADTFVSRMALEKARAGWQHEQRTSLVPVVGSDTVVVLDDNILGKPHDREHAILMLEVLSGRCHQVLSAVAIKQGDDESVVVSVSEVCFRHLSRAEIEAYWLTGEPEGKAGAYAIQGRAALFIRHLQGSYSSVMGLPLYETAELLTKSGVLPLTATE